MRMLVDIDNDNMTFAFKGDPLDMLVAYTLIGREMLKMKNVPEEFKQVFKDYIRDNNGLYKCICEDIPEKKDLFTEFENAMKRAMRDFK